MKNRILLLSTILAMFASSAYSQVEDDIYYNPKKDKTVSKTGKMSSKSNYISNFQDMDVDEYNNRGQYYTSPVDTIGYETETAQDFVYTTQIQKFYNPTIVVDNQDLLQDVLDNSYGNVNIEFNFNGSPYFSGWYPSSWYNWAYSPVFSWSIGFPYWSWSWNWGWNPSYWGPSWGWGWNSPYWGPSWSWGWNPSYWGPSWGWGPSYWGPRPPMGRPVTYSHGGNRPVNPGHGWANNNHRPGNVGPGHSSSNYYGRPGSIAGNSGGNSSRPSNSTSYGRQPGHGAYQSTTTRPGGYSGTRPSGSSTQTRPSSTTTTRPSGSSNTRPGGYTSTSGNKSSNSGYRNSGSSSSGYRSSGSSSSSSSSNRSYRNSGSSSSGGRSTTSGGYSGGRTSSSGGFGGGSRGGRR